MDKKGLPIVLTLTAMTFIDTVTGWFEIVEVPPNDKSSARVSLLFNQTWLCRYPRPKQVRFDNGYKNSETISYRYWKTLI